MCVPRDRFKLLMLTLLLSIFWLSTSELSAQLPQAKTEQEKQEFFNNWPAEMTKLRAAINSQQTTLEKLQTTDRKLRFQLSQETDGGKRQPLLDRLKEITEELKDAQVLLEFTVFEWTDQSELLERSPEHRHAFAKFNLKLREAEWKAVQEKLDARQKQLNEAKVDTAAQRGLQKELAERVRELEVEAKYAKKFLDIAREKVKKSGP